MPVYKLSYFNAKGLGEAIRMILVYSGKSFQDERTNYDEWISRSKRDAPFGKLPILEINGKVCHQSMAICRYLGKQNHLAGASDWENLQIDISAETFIDMKKHITELFFESKEDMRKEKLKLLLNETVPYYFERFEEIIKNNEGYFGIPRISWVDFYMVGYSETMEAILKEKVFENYSNISGLRKKLFSNPSIKRWISQRPNTEY